ALPAVRDVRVRDLPRDHRVVRCNVGGTHDALHAHELAAGVDGDPLLAAHQQVAVGEALGHGDADGAVEGIALLAAAVTREAVLVVHGTFEHGNAIDGDRRAEHGRTGHLRGARLAGVGA